MQLVKSHTVPAFLLMLAGTLANAQPAEPAPPANEAVDEVVITAQRSDVQLREKISQAEDSMFDIYNKQNTDHFFDIRCRTDRRRDSHIYEKKCLPEYVWRAMDQEATSLALSGLSSKTPPPPVVTTNYYKPELDKKFEQAVKDDPQLLDAVITLFDLREQLDKRITPSADEKK